jgi:hypothetical protein
MAEEWVELEAPCRSGNFSYTAALQVVEGTGDLSNPLVEIITVVLKTQGAVYQTRHLIPDYLIPQTKHYGRHPLAFIAFDSLLVGHYRCQICCRS